MKNNFENLKKNWAQVTIYKVQENLTKLIPNSISSTSIDTSFNSF